MDIIKTKTLANILLGENKEIDNSNFIKEQHFAIVQDIFTKMNYCILEDKTTFYLGRYLPAANPIMVMLSNENITDQRILIDNGSVEITKSSRDSAELLFKGNKYFDRFMLTKTKIPGSYVLHNATQKTKRTLSVQIQSISEVNEVKTDNLTQQTLTGANIKRYKGIALAEGVWNGTFYPWKTIRPRAPEIEGVQIREEHMKTADAVHGFVDKQSINDDLKELAIEFVIVTKKGQEMIEKSQKEGLSVGLTVDVQFNPELKRDEAVDLGWMEASLVENPACKKCWIDQAS